MKQYWDCLQIISWASIALSLTLNLHTHTHTSLVHSEKEFVICSISAHKFSFLLLSKVDMVTTMHRIHTRDKNLFSSQFYESCMSVRPRAEHGDSNSLFSWNLEWEYSKWKNDSFFFVCKFDRARIVHWLCSLLYDYCHLIGCLTDCGHLKTCPCIDYVGIATTTKSGISMNNISIIIIHLLSCWCRESDNKPTFDFFLFFVCHDDAVHRRSIQMCSFAQKLFLINIISSYRQTMCVCRSPLGDTFVFMIGKYTMTDAHQQTNHILNIEIWFAK